MKRPLALAVFLPYAGLALDLGYRTFHRDGMLWALAVYDYLALAGCGFGLVRGLAFGFARRSWRRGLAWILGAPFLYFALGLAAVLVVRPFRFFSDIFYSNLGIFLFAFFWFGLTDCLLFLVPPLLRRRRAAP